MSEPVCKHCGASADRIYAEVTCTGWMEVGIEVETDGTITADTFGGPQEVDDVDVDLTLIPSEVRHER